MIHWKEDAWPGDVKLFECIQILLKDHPKLLDFLFHPHHPQLNAPGPVLRKRARCFSSGELILVKVALDMWDGSGNALLSDVYEILDGQHYFQVLKAIEALKGRRLVGLSYGPANEKCPPLALANENDPPADLAHGL